MGILKGKLVKKDDTKIIKNLDIQLYPWLDFKEKNIVFPDNPRRSVILQKYHDPKEMKDKVKDATQFLQSLEKKTVPLFPVDLTADYERGIKELIKRKRRRMMGEEEAMALELAEIDATQSTKFRTPRQKSTSVQVDAKVMPKKDNIEEIIPTSNVKIIKEEVQEEIIQPMSKEVVQPMPKEVIKEKKSPEVVTEPVVVQPPEISQEKIDEIEKKAQEKGYLEGFKNGEERAIQSQESKYETVFQNIAHVVDQIEKLKDSLYVESKDVFVEIIKLCTEKILREQLKISDTALISMFNEVIKSVSQKASVKIELNTQDLLRLKKHVEELGIQDRVTLKEDKDKASGDFTVESERGISIVSLQKSIENIVEKLKAELFSDEEEITKAVG